MESEQKEVRCGCNFCTNPHGSETHHIPGVDIMANIFSNSEIWMMVLAIGATAMYSYWLVGEAEKQGDR
jgi:hypothetical protein